MAFKQLIQTATSENNTQDNWPVIIQAHATSPNL
jgi:hypothetical protein